MISYFFLHGGIPYVRGLTHPGFAKFIVLASFTWTASNVWAFLMSLGSETSIACNFSKIKNIRIYSYCRVFECTSSPNLHFSDWILSGKLFETRQVLTMLRPSSMPVSRVLWSWWTLHGCSCQFGCELSSCGCFGIKAGWIKVSWLSGSLKRLIIVLGYDFEMMLL